MDKKKVIHRIFQEGLLVSPQALELIDDNNIDDVITSAKKKKIKTIENLDFLNKPKKTKQTSKTKEEIPTEDTIQKEKKEEPLMEKTPAEETSEEELPHEEKKKSDIEITIQEPKTKTKLIPKDFIEFYNKKYEGRKEMLLKKMQAVSINNTKKAFSEVSIIGMIKEKIPQGFIIEDPTGEIVVVSNEPGLVEDDVVGVSGVVREEKIIYPKIIYPDISLNRKICSIDTEIILTTGFSDKLQADYVFTHDIKQKANKKLFVIKPKQCKITMKKKEDTIIILKADFPKEIDPEEATQWLKKRHLPHSRKINFNEDDLIIKDIPDILWIISKSKWTKIHKGVIMISMTEKDAARINLRNKEIQFINNIN